MDEGEPDDPGEDDERQSEAEEEDVPGEEERAAGRRSDGEEGRDAGAWMNIILAHDHGYCGAMHVRTFVSVLAVFLH